MRILAVIFTGLALLLSIAATIYLSNAPLYMGFKTHCTDSGCETIEATKTLTEANGPGAVIQLITVTLFSGVPLLYTLRKSTSQLLVTWVTTLLLFVYSIAGSMTVGLFFMPSAFLLLIAAIISLFIRRYIDLRKPARILSGLALVIAVLATISLFNATVYEEIGSSCTTVCDVNDHCTESCEMTQVRVTLIEENGLGVLVLPIAATLVSGAPLFVALRRSSLQRLLTWISTLLFLTYSIVARFTVGYIYIPSAILLLIVAFVTLFIRKKTIAEITAIVN